MDVCTGSDRPPDPEIRLLGKCKLGKVGFQLGDFDVYLLNLDGNTPFAHLT